MNSGAHKGERISAPLVNKTLFLLHSVGESAAARFDVASWWDDNWSQCSVE